LLAQTLQQPAKGSLDELSACFGSRPIVTIEPIEKRALLGPPGKPGFMVAALVMMAQLWQAELVVESGSGSGDGSIC